MMKREGAALVETLWNVVEGIAASVVGGGAYDIGGGEQVQPFTETYSALAPSAGSKRFQRLVHSSPFMKGVPW